MITFSGGDFPGNYWPGVTDRAFNLDPVEGWLLDIDKTAQFSTEVSQLAQLWNGIHFLACQVERSETLLSLEDRQPGRVQTGTGIGKKMGNIMGLMECLFHWYAVSAINYLHLTFCVAVESGLVNTSKGKRDALRDEYCNRCCRGVLEYRNKVAAHFSKSWPKNDNERLQRQSVFSQLSLASGQFWVGLIDLRQNMMLVSPQPMSWSVTDVHGQLCRRFQRDTEFPRAD